MDTFWKGKNAIVTGAASGIGLALAAGLAERGARVWAADIDAAGAERAAASLGSNAHPVTLDVRDAAAFRELVERVARDAGTIDVLFNNAGILHAGEVHEFEKEQCDKIIDVNIRGVVNGTLAAYPLMVRQRSGHIVNTASLAGLAPAPLLSTYAMTKHAVVGLSTSLRYEAERYGVRVSAICPAGVETPLLDEGAASGSHPGRWQPDVRNYLTLAAGPLSAVDKVVREALRGVERNRALIIIPARARLTALAYRLVPGLVGAFGRQVIAKVIGDNRGDAS
jgi:NAD(P)-dependent dehydrogenase (short-subunit alcohol dehydrogenase family)